MENVPEISVQDLPADAVILDVREDDEWTAGHAPGATHVPLGEVPGRLGELPDADPLYVICRSGYRIDVRADSDGAGRRAVRPGGGLARPAGH